MKYLLDSNIAIEMFRRPAGKVAGTVRGHAARKVTVLSSIVTHELYYGVYRSDQPEYNLATIELLNMEVLDFTDVDARSAGRVRADLAKLGTPIGPYDVLIAGQALARGLKLVTHNVREFSRVEGLRIEDWLADESPE